MGVRRWHLEHQDGQKWTRDELDRAVRVLRFGRYGRYDKLDRCQTACIDEDGRPYLLDMLGEWWPVADYQDVVVVSDE